MANAVTPVILGLLSIAPRSGYEIKATVDRSTRYFWAASYGQIYPELRRLENEGLIDGEDAPNGARPRRVYRLTPDGRAELEAWLRSEGDLTIELRDELLLRIFFADAVGREEALLLIETRKRIFEEVLARLHEIDSLGETTDSGQAGDFSAILVRRVSPPHHHGFGVVRARRGDRCRRIR